MVCIAFSKIVILKNDAIFRNWVGEAASAPVDGTSHARPREMAAQDGSDRAASPGRGCCHGGVPGC